MHRKALAGNPIWSTALPVLSCLLLAAIWERPLGWTLLGVVVIVLGAAVFTAVHHAEIIALRVGEPFGTLVLAVFLFLAVVP